MWVVGRGLTVQQATQAHHHSGRVSVAELSSSAAPTPGADHAKLPASLRPTAPAHLTPVVPSVSANTPASFHRALCRSSDSVQ